MTGTHVFRSPAGGWRPGAGVRALAAQWLDFTLYPLLAGVIGLVMGDGVVGLFSSGGAAR